MSLAAAIKPKGGGLSGGWLSMAPQVDEEPPVASTSTSTSPRSHSPNYISTNGGSNTATTATSTAAPLMSSSSIAGYHHARPRVLSTAPRRLLPRTNARFKVGDSSQLATPSSPAPESPYSRGSDYDSPPPFDVRASFAPMPKWSAGGADEPKAVAPRSNAEKANMLSNGMELDECLEEEDEINEENDVAGSRDEKGIHYGGIQWKGKTAHAVEQEMEALGDRTVMSYAPDAVYLASRLEGLKRNLEVGGDRLKRWAWEDYEEEQEQEQVDEAVASTDKAEKVEQIEPVDDLAMPALEQQVNDSKISSLTVSEGVTPNDDLMDDPMEAMATSNEAGEESDQFKGIPRITMDPTAKAAALDARVEIRTLRRPDLEQVRELHCYHGETDKVDTETYTTSAGFLLRLLVDEHHVCLVAVAKPLPEPPSLPTRFSPGAPPPSLDMPPSQSPFLVAGQGRHLGPTSSSSLRKFASTSQALSKLAPVTHTGKLLVEATAPRSFGVGADSSSSLEEEEEGEVDGDSFETKEQESLFEAAKRASSYRTGETSPDAIAEVDENEQEEEQEQQRSQEDLLVDSRHSPNTPPPSANATSILAGPTHDVAPPRAVRVMGAPPLNGIVRDSEAILGVASARIKVVQRTEGDDVFGKSEALDSSWPGLDPKGEKSMVTREAHIITLSVLPGERGQGLGGRLLDHLLDECKRRTAGPRIHLASGSNTTLQEMATAPRIHENAPMRTFLEVHPTNTSAVNLYNSRKFHQVEGAKGVVKHYFRGDNRIPNSVRVKVGGSDAIRLERFDFK